VIAQGAAPGTGIPGQRQIEGNAPTVAEYGAAGKSRPPAKWRRVLRALLDRPSIDRRVAAADPFIRDSVLPSTIAELKKYGLSIDRVIVRRPGYGGQPAFLAEYSLPASERDLAQRLLADTSRRRGRRR
jgi:hypothetical protein